MDIEQINKKKELIDYYGEIKNFQKRRQVCLEVLKETPKDVDVLAALAYSYVNMDQVEEGITTCFEALENLTDPIDKSYIFYLLGILYHTKNQYEKSLQYHKESIENNPNNAVYLSQYAVLLEEIGEKSEYEEILSRAISLEPKNPTVLGNKFEIYHNAYSDMEAERDILTQFLEVSSNPFLTNLYMAWFNKKYGYTREAYKFYIEVALLSPEYPFINAKLDYYEQHIHFLDYTEELLIGFEPQIKEKLLRYVELYEYSNVMKYYCEVLRKNYDKNLFYLFSKAQLEFRNCDFKLCVSICLELMGTKAENHIIDVLGKCYFNLGKYEQAMPLLEKALEINPTNSKKQIHFMRCLAELGKIDKALSFMEKSRYYHICKIETLECRFIILYKFGDCIEDELQTLEKFKNYSQGQAYDLMLGDLFYALTYEKYKQKANALKYMNKVIEANIAFREQRRILKRIEKMNEIGGQNGRTGIFGIFKRKKSGRQIYPLHSWKTIQREEPL